ncbi:MAG: AMP-binding protein [Bacteroidales bacterium]|jgi:acyl-CoA synthetase (AMP-forming)/AMP-acid ligase II|nr:AMP-binding protein [Bacteroidales bacterium]
MRRSDITIEQASDEGTGLLTLADLLNKRAACTPDRCAFIFLRDGENDEERITYGQLYNSALAISRELTETTRPGDRALMFYPAGLEFIKALFGCFYAGVIAVPAYPPRKNRSLERLRALASDSGASIVLSTDDIRQTSQRSFSDTIELQKLTWLSTNLISPSKIQSPNRPIAQSPNRPIAKSPNRPIAKSPCSSTPPALQVDPKALW